ncbi:hypothetical protein PBY51_024889 [Eleginops maclovinus]|uniref:Uncharacterized protein n=1 Tax=Eleginops maclovinus TaxID=56733 RepID=A0AAN8APG7_ELEMC|nr:hypothetical protein PBY51_024889 [Eleginops maclovinus]
MGAYKSHCRLHWTNIFSSQDASCETLNVSRNPHNKTNSSHGHEVPHSLLSADPHLHVPESCTRLVRQLLPRLHKRDEGEREEEH